MVKEPPPLHQARQPPVISRLHWSVDHVCPHAGPVLVHEVSYRARQFVISGVFYRWREHGVFLQMRHFPSFRCWSRLRWSSALHSSFVPVEFLLPPERTVTYCAHEWFGPTATRVSLQGESARENASACRTFMHRDRCCCGCCCFVPIFPARW